jgi:hypothetical protein
MALVLVERVVELVVELAAWAGRKQGSSQCGFARGLTFADLLEFSRYRCQVPRAAKGERPTPMHPTWPRCHGAVGPCLGLNHGQRAFEKNLAILCVGK